MSFQDPMKNYVQIALKELEKIQTEKLAEHGFCNEANAISKARVALDQSIHHHGGWWHDFWHSPKGQDGYCEI